ncbi:MAG: right-handed parallel beta-helix repeat-containing protein [Verrucomicrobia bacterium]|nr:right-handed parallel beta-helix repeat-containing protein [Verrucomicrobiota bacterium]
MSASPLALIRLFLVALAVSAVAGRSAPALPSIPAKKFEVTAYGAKGDGQTDNAPAIHRAIEAAVAAGGGAVVIPAAAKPFLSGPIALQSRVALQLEAGATLQPLPYGKYPLEGRAHANFITAEKVHDVAIIGAGTINGDGAAWWAAFRANKQMPRRPDLVRFRGCTNVLVAGVSLVNSPCFHLAFNTTDHVTIEGVTVQAPEDAPNTDGIDPGGSHYLIRGCRVSTGDDNIAVKAGGSYCSDLTITNCVFGTGHGLSVGGQSNRGLDGMTVTNCTFEGTTSGLRLKADPTQGGPVRNITYANLTMKNVKYPFVFYSYYNKAGNPGNGKFAPVAAAAWNITPPNSLASSTIPTWENITVRDVTVTGATGSSVIWGLPLAQGFFSNVRFINLRYAGEKSFLLYNARDAQFIGSTVAMKGNVPAFAVHNALAITAQPADQHTKPGGSARFSVTVADHRATVRWTRDGRPLADGPQPGGETIAGAETGTLVVTGVQPATAGRYAAVATTALDLYDVKAHQLTPAALPATATSASAELTVDTP